MLIENIMYFALGLLAAGLVALVIMPAVWKRAVRLTKRRIEAATPITMAEFRADKDQLRAEFALSTRRLEMAVETLRQKLANQSSDIDRARTELGALETERTQHRTVVAELETRAAEMNARIADLERDSADLTQRLRMRDRELAARSEELNTLRHDRPQAINAQNLVTAEASMANAETQLNAILAETGSLDQKAGDQQLLADKLGLEDELDALRSKVAEVEATILADWGSDQVEEADLIERLNTIATGVSRLVNAPQGEPPQAAEESLFDRVQRFAAATEIPKAPPATKRKSRSAADRLTALREIQQR